MSKMKVYPIIVMGVLWFLLVSAFGFNPILEAKQNRSQTFQTIKQTEQAVPQIVGGREATPGNYPFVGMLMFVNGAGLQCTGSLIDPEWVLTAAHCVDNFDGREVIFGRHDRRESDGIRLGEQGIYIHPGFQVGGSFNNDIALIHLERPITEFSTVNVGRDDRLNTPGRMVTAVGWGRDSVNVLMNTLHEVEMPIFRTGDCQWREFNGMFGEVAEKMLCTGFKDGGSATCSGDSGAPVLTWDNEAWTLIGVTSASDRECATGDRNSGHTRVTAYADWIDAHLNGNPPYPLKTDGLFHRLPDQYEPNDAHLTATPLLTSTESVSQAHVISDGSDEDWFTFTLTQSGRIVTQLSMSNDDFLSLVMTLFNSDLTVRDEESITFGDDYTGFLGSCDWFEYDVLPAGTYYIRVQDARDYPRSTPYTISQSRDCIQPDQYEPNGSQGRAKMITMGESQTHTSISENDTDWLTFVLTETTEVAIETYGHYSIYTNLALYRDSQANLVGVDEDGDLLRFCGADALSAGTYMIEVTDGLEKYVEGYPLPDLPDQIESEGGFQYTIEMSDCSHLHESHSYEPNDSSDTATPITVGETQTHTDDSRNDNDWMTFVLTETTPLVIQVQSSERHDVELFTVQDDELQRMYNRESQTDSAMMRCGRDALTAGTYYLLVEPRNQTDPYTVSIDSCNDIEPNDDPENGTPLVMGEVVTHAISFVDDVDWFTFTLPTTQSISINTSWEGERQYTGEFDIDLYRDDELIGRQSAPYIPHAPTRNLYLPFCYENALPPGEYALKVVKPNSGTTPIYTVLMDVCPDTAEPNNSAETAIPITVDSAVEGSIYEVDDEDWFVLTLDEPTALYPDIVMDVWRYGSSWMGVTVYDEALNVLRERELFDNTHCERPPLSAGTYTMRVYRDGATVQPTYTFRMKRCDPLPAGRLYWDAYEPDGGFYDYGAYANPIVAGEWQTHNVSHIGDSDWMRFTVDEQSDVAIFLESSDGDMTMALYTVSQSPYSELTGGSHPPSSYLVARNDDYYGFNPHIRICDLPPDTYYIEAQDYLNNETVSEYRVKFEYVSCNDLYLPMLSMR